MTHHEVLFPRLEEWGHEGGPGFQTGVGEADSGHVTAVSRRSKAKRKFFARFDAKDEVESSMVLDFYYCRNGRGCSFNYEDPRDHTTNPSPQKIQEGIEIIDFDDQVLGVGDGVTTQFQLIKRYQDSGGFSYVRALTKIKEDTTRIGVAGVEKTAGTDFTVNLTTGMVTFATAPANLAQVTGGCWFYVPVRFGEEVDELVRARIDAPDVVGLTTLTLNEELSPTSALEDLYLGGSNPTPLSGVIALDYRYTHVRFSPSVATTKVLLPNLASAPTGGPLFVLSNPHASGIPLRLHDDSALVYTLPAGETHRMYVLYDAAGAKMWVAV